MSISNFKILILMLIAVSSITFVQASIDSTSPISYINKAGTATIRFDQGAITGIVEGVLPARKNRRSYHFDAQSGQYAVVNITGLPSHQEIANVGVVISPSGIQDGTKGGIVYQHCLLETGTYQLDIARNLMATNGGPAGYHVEVIILPRYASAHLCD